ncbi:MAG: hypothetical protein HYT94_00345 [Parcubacteria group bacterium]|nr:hypothetical protein [Parcubacteria group bacterium]
MATKKSSPAVKAIKTKKVEPKKKVAVKSTPAKKGEKKKPLIIVTGEACFWIHNGPALCSMKDLREALLTISEEQFLHHTAMGRSDFSAWVLGVLRDKKCADGLLKAKNMKDALLTVEKHLKNYAF